MYNQTALVFFNHWHHGDLFTPRAMVSDVISQLPQFASFYAHRCNQNVTKDIAQFFPNSDELFKAIGEGNKIEFANGIFFFNTWVGAWPEGWMKYGHKHPSNIEHYETYYMMYELAKYRFGWDLKLKDTVWDYIPNIDYSKYNLAPADKFMSEHKNVVLFSNSDAKSKQTQIGNMKELIEDLASKFDGLTFVATQKFDTNIKNIYFTSDIFNQDCDLNEISYLSTLCPVLVGKNSSPSTYFNVIPNYKNSQKTMIDFSHDIRDTLSYGLDMPAEFIFSDTTEHQKLVDIVSDAIMRRY